MLLRGFSSRRKIIPIRYTHKSKYHVRNSCCYTSWFLGWSSKTSIRLHLARSPNKAAPLKYELIFQKRTHARNVTDWACVLYVKRIVPFSTIENLFDKTGTANLPAVPYNDEAVIRTGRIRRARCDAVPCIWATYYTWCSAIQEMS